MSAYLVSKQQIDYILTATPEPSIWSPSRGKDGEYLGLDRIGDALWQENQRSVNYRYSEGDTVSEYVYQQTQEPVSPVQALKFIQCLRYQSCETPDWEDTKAAALLDRLQIDIIRVLPGYEDANWSI